MGRTSFLLCVVPACETDAGKDLLTSVTHARYRAEANKCLLEASRAQLGAGVGPHCPIYLVAWGESLLL